MEKVSDHPDRNSSYQCMKHNKVYLSDETLACRDPKLYCKFRSSCVIWFVTKKDSKDIL